MLRPSPADRGAIRPPLSIHRPAEDDAGSVEVLVSGYTARILTWTADQWARLVDRPADARPGGNGVWAALRID